MVAVRAGESGLNALSTSTRPSSRSSSISGSTRQRVRQFGPAQVALADPVARANRGERPAQLARGRLRGGRSGPAGAPPVQPLEREEHVLPEAGVVPGREQPDHLAAGLQHAEEFVHAGRVGAAGVVQGVPQRPRRTRRPAKAGSGRRRPRSARQPVPGEVVADEVRVVVGRGRPTVTSVPVRAVADGVAAEPGAEHEQGFAGVAAELQRRGEPGPVPLVPLLLQLVEPRRGERPSSRRRGGGRRADEFRGWRGRGVGARQRHGRLRRRGVGQWRVLPAAATGSPANSRQVAERRRPWHAPRRCPGTVPGSNDRGHNPAPGPVKANAGERQMPAEPCAAASGAGAASGSLQRRGELLQFRAGGTHEPALGRGEADVRRRRRPARRTSTPRSPNCATKTPAPVFWLLGKTQSGKTSIVRYLTGADDAVIGSGFRPCTKTSPAVPVPHRPSAAAVVPRHPRAWTSPGYDPAEDIAAFDPQAHVVVVTAKATDFAQGNVRAALEPIRRASPSRPVVLCVTCLHEAIPRQPHPAPYPFDPLAGRDGPVPADVPGAAAAVHRRAPAGVRGAVRRVRADRPDEARGRVPRPELRRRAAKQTLLRRAARGVPADAPAAEGGDRRAEGRAPAARDAGHPRVQLDGGDRRGGAGAVRGHGASSPASRPGWCTTWRSCTASR